MHLAGLVRHFRLAAGLSQEELAERSGLSARTVSDFERGLRTAPRPETIRMLAEGLGLSDSERASLIAAARPELAPHLPVESSETALDLDAWRSELPRTAGELIGRERETADLTAMLSNGTARLITLTGPGGVGKTRLALAVAHEMTAAFDGGVVFVALAPVRDASLVVPTIARAIGVQETGDRPLIDRIGDALGNRPALLVLDNMEQVPDAAADVAALLAGIPELRVLVTSRGALRLSSEQLYPVPTLRLPDPEAQLLMEDATRSPAVALFIDRARQVQPAFALTETNVSPVVEICRWLDGLPLAIELAAARTKLLPPSALLARMERRLPVLTGGPRDLPERLQTMRAAIAWSYELLSPEEQTAFRQLAVFDGGFTLEAAESIMTASTQEMPGGAVVSQLDLLAALVDRGLVWQAEQPDGDARFGMLETIREFGLEQLIAAGEADAVHGAHAAWFLALAETLDTDGGPTAYGELDRIERELPNFRVALAWTEQIDDTRLGLRLAQSLFRLWMLRSHRIEGRGWLERALARDGGEPSAERAATLVYLGEIEHTYGNVDLGVRYRLQGLALARALDHRRTIVFALAHLAGGAVDAGDAEQANLFLAEVEPRGAHPDDWIDVPGFVLYNRGMLARQLDDLDSARRFFTDALARFDRKGDVYYRAIASEMLGLTQCECGDYAKAVTSLLDSLDDWRTVGTRESLIDWMAMVATLAAAVDEPERASRWFGAVEAQAEIYGFNFPVPELERFARTAERVRTGPADPNWSAGRTLTLAQVTAEAAAWLDDSAGSFWQPVSPIEDR